MTDRRTFFAMLAAGMVMTAEGVWMPGTKLISIPKRKTLEWMVELEFAVLHSDAVQALNDGARTISKRTKYWAFEDASGVKSEIAIR